MKFTEFVNGAIPPVKPKRFTDMELAIMEGGGSLDTDPPKVKKVSALAQAVREAETGTAYAKNISQEFRKLGYRKIGSGADSTVWAKESGYVIKVLMPEDSGSRAIEVFKKFYEFCSERQDLACLPVINEYNTIDVLDREYIQIDMERLLPVKRGSLDEGVVWFFSDYVASKEPWDRVNKLLSMPKTWEIFEPSVAEKFATAWSQIADLASYKTLYNVMSLLYNTGRINKFGWDLHTENVMRRRNGDLVIVDPWFADNTLLESSIIEAVHPDITSDEYFNDPTDNVRMGDFEFNARTFSGALGDPNARGLQIRAYDPKRPNGGLSIGSADFIVKSDKKGNQWLESDDTEVDEKYRGRGVAAMMYAFAKSLGNDIKDSPYKSKAGGDMWTKWGADAKHLVGEQKEQFKGQQGVAEGLNESAYEEAWELISQPVPEIQQFVQQLGLSKDDATAKQIAPMIDAAPDTQIPAASIPKLKNLANKGNDVQTLKAIQQISGKPDAAQQYAKLMQARDAGEGRNRGYDVSGLIKSVQSGNYEAPVLLKLPTGVYVIGGRTRLYAALALGIPAKVKIISANNFKQGVTENFADGRVKGKSRPGRVKRAGASCNGSVSELRDKAKNASGERAKMYHWCANMKSGKK